MQDYESHHHDFHLPDHTDELGQAEKAIKKYQDRFKAIRKKNSISDREHSCLYENTVRLLIHLGKLSMPVLQIEEDLERQYTKRYATCPELAKKLWLDHFERLNRPYNILKNRCFRLLDGLDELYMKLNRKHPPNWE